MDGGAYTPVLWDFLLVLGRFARGASCCLVARSGCVDFRGWVSLAGMLLVISMFLVLWISLVYGSANISQSPGSGHFPSSRVKFAPLGS